MHCRLQCSNRTRRRRPFSVLGTPSAAAAAAAASCLLALTLVNRCGCHTTAASFVIVGSRPQACFVGGGVGAVGVARRRSHARREGRSCRTLSLTGGRNGESSRGTSPGCRRSIFCKSIWASGTGACQRPWQAWERGAETSAGPAASGDHLGTGVFIGGRFRMSTSALGTGGGDEGVQAVKEKTRRHNLVSAGVAVVGAGAGAVATTVTAGDDEAVKGEAATAAPQELAKMKLAELKALYRDSGGKPGTLRKAELMERLKRSFEGQTVTSADVGPDSPPQLPKSRPATVTETDTGSTSASAGEIMGDVDLEVETATKINAALAADEASISSPQFSVRRDGARIEVSARRSLSADEENAKAAGVSSSTKVFSREPEQRFEPAPFCEGSTTTPRSLRPPSSNQRAVVPNQASAVARPAFAPAGRMQPSISVPHDEQVPAGIQWDDALSRGPAAVVAAARARGVAAAAAASKFSAGSRLRAMEEVNRHTEAMRSTAVRNGSAQSSEKSQHLQNLQQQQLQLQENQPRGREERSNDHGDLPSVVRDLVASAGGAEAVAPMVASVAKVVGIPYERNDPPADKPSANLSAAMVAAAAATSKTTTANNRLVSSSTGSVKGFRELGQETDSAARNRGRKETADQSTPMASGVWKHRAARDSTGTRRVSGRPRLMPKMPNPWARSGSPGSAAVGLPEDGDVVDEYLASMMVQASDKERCPSVDPLFDRERRLEAMPGASMQLHFLGTASCIPSTSRGVSCTVLRNEGDLWMFDVGEGTQVQIQRSSMKPTRVTKIFITHAHGDHSFGLPGMLCLMGQNYERTLGKRVEIYGPTGLRVYLRAALRYTYSKVTVPYVVHELKDVPHLHGDVCKRPEDFHLDIDQDSRFGEQRGGRDIYPNRDGIFEVYRDDKAIVRAAPMKHGVPCVGYCVEEPDRPGRLKIEHMNPILEEHKEAIEKATGKKGVGWILGLLKAMKPAESITLPGTKRTIHSSEAVGPPTRGRKVVILGDTCDASKMVPLAEGADVVVHESTNAFLSSLDQGKTYADVEREAIEHGHSTPVMASAFADRVGAKTLVLNHFSARYRGDASDASVATMLRIEQQAMRAGALERHQVIAAWDLLQLPVLAADEWEANRATARENDKAHAAALLERAVAWKEGSVDSSGETISDRLDASLREVGGAGVVDVSREGASDAPAIGGKRER